MLVLVLVLVSVFVFSDVGVSAESIALGVGIRAVVGPHLFEHGRVVFNGFVQSAEDHISA